MSNRPKGFKRMPIFYIVRFNHTTGKAIIKSFDKRLLNDERYQKLLRHARNIVNNSNFSSPKHLGSKKLRSILSIIRNW